MSYLRRIQTRTRITSLIDRIEQSTSSLLERVALTSNLFELVAHSGIALSSLISRIDLAAHTGHRGFTGLRKELIGRIERHTGTGSCS